MRRKILAIGLMLALVLGVFTGCAPKQEVAAPAPTQTAEPVTLTVAGGWPDCRALDVVAAAFTTQYPNCTIQYEYVQDYYDSILKRFEGDTPFDLFFTTNIQPESATLPYALDLKSRSDLNLDDTYPGLINNFLFQADTTKLYSLPLGAEIRGMFVNKTLLSSLGLEAPADQASLLACCQTLKEHGYIPLHGNPGSFGQYLFYPWICNLVANADDPAAVHARVNAREPGVSELFREPFALLYSLVENGYYDYKTVQSDQGLFIDVTNEGYSRDFLNIRQVGDAYEKADDLGQVAFMPAPLSLQSTLDKFKEDYHSEIEYVFILSPVAQDGGFAYLSPAHGIAAYKDSKNVDWSVKFLNFLFQPENNQLFAKAFNAIPNTKEAYSYVRTLYDVPDTHISEVGEVTFDYGFFNLVSQVLTDTSKGNNPKYMQDDGAGNLSLYPFEHYMQQLEDGFQQK